MKSVGSIVVNSAFKATFGKGFRLIACITLLFTSIVMPLWMASSAIVEFAWGKSLGFPSKELRDYAGCLKGRELWYCVERYTDNPLSQAFQKRLFRADLATGVESDTGIVVPGDVSSLIWINDELYVLNSNAVHKVEGTTLRLIAPF